MRPEVIEAVKRLVNAAGYQQTEAVITTYGDAPNLLILQRPASGPGPHLQ